MKNKQGRAVADETREDELKSKMMQACDEIGFDKTLAARFLNFLLNESVKVQSSEEQTHLTIFLKAKELESTGKDIIHLEVGEPDFKPPENVRQGLLEIYDGGFGKYGPSEGIPEFRNSIAEFANNNFGCEINSKNVMVSPGARFGVFLTFSS